VENGGQNDNQGISELFVHARIFSDVVLGNQRCSSFGQNVLPAVKSELPIWDLRRPTGDRQTGTTKKTGEQPDEIKLEPIYRLTFRIESRPPDRAAGSGD
jgi:hypothetical protein